MNHGTIEEETNLSLAGDVTTIPENSLGLFPLEISSLMEYSDQMTMQAICPMVRIAADNEHSNECEAEVADIPENSLGLFLLDILSFLDAGNQRTMQAICPMVRWQQELMIDRHDFGLVWTTAPDRKITKWVRHGGGYGSTESDRILMGRSKTEHWATAEPVMEENVLGCYNMIFYYPKPANLQGRRRALIVNPRVIADEGIMPGCVTRNEDGDIIIGDGFLAGVEASSVWFVGAEDVVSIGDNFLRNSRIQSVCFHGLNNVTRIGCNFLDGSTSLTRVSFRELCSVTVIGDWFLYGCTSLTSVSFLGLSSLTEIGDGFLRDCTSLTKVSFQDLGNVTTILNSFLEGCTSLTSVSFRGLSSLTEIGDWFLFGCRSLTSVSFDEFSSVTTIGDGFLEKCPSLRPSGIAASGAFRRRFESQICSEITII